jgi:hypothetical protein
MLNTLPYFRIIERDRRRSYTNRISISIMHVFTICSHISSPNFPVSRKFKCPAELWTWDVCQRVKCDVVKTNIQMIRGVLQISRQLGFLISSCFLGQANRASGLTHRQMDDKTLQKPMELRARRSSLFEKPNLESQHKLSADSIIS